MSDTLSLEPEVHLREKEKILHSIGFFSIQVIYKRRWHEVCFS